MPTYTPLQSIVLTSSTSSVSISNIPQNYQDLVLVIQGQDTGSDNQYFRLNGDTNSNYSFSSLSGNGTSTNTNRVTNATSGRFAWYAAPSNSNLNWIGRVNFMNYSNTTTYKTILGRTDVVGTTYPATEITANTWRSTSAINSITLYWGSTDTWAAGTTFDLYGIKAGSTKAYGGAVYTDGTYYYHLFKSTDALNVTANVTADILAVAGGGSAGTSSSYASAGGGAGGVIAFGSQSLTAGTTYAVTVGAGGAFQTLSGSGAQGNSGTNSQFGSLTAAVGGGGGGGYNALSSAGASGGSGGGMAFPNTGTASGTAGQGNAGGANNGTNGSCAGGGGAGGVGQGNSGTTPGNGGAGTNSVTNWGALSGMLTATGLGVGGFIAGGGAGGGYNGGSATGGSGGGGNSGQNGATSSTYAGTSGTALTGSGGGGSWGQGTPGSGGSGFVVVRYAL